MVITFITDTQEQRTHAASVHAVLHVDAPAQETFGEGRSYAATAEGMFRDADDLAAFLEEERTSWER